MTRFPILKILFVPRQQERLGQGSPRNSRARGAWEHEWRRRGDQIPNSFAAVR